MVKTWGEIILLASTALSAPAEIDPRPTMYELIAANSISDDGRQDIEERVITNFESPKMLKVQDLDAKWDDAYKYPLTYKLIENEHMPEQFSRKNNLAQLRVIIRKAFQVWEQSGDFRFIEVSNEQDAEIMVSFQPTVHNRPDGSPCDSFGANTLAHAFYPGRRHTDKYAHNPTDVSGDLHFDAERNWIYASPEDVPDNKYFRNGMNIFAVAVHELGHSLGFGHLEGEENREAIMYPSINHKWSTEDAYLSPMDIDLIRSKYGERRNFFLRNWIAFVMMFALLLSMVLYEILRKKEIIATNENWKSLAHRRPKASSLRERIYGSFKFSGSREERFVPGEQASTTNYGVNQPQNCKPTVPPRPPPKNGKSGYVDNLRSKYSSQY